MDICVRDADGEWRQFQPIDNTIADSEIDNYLFYRLLKPVHTVYGEVDIYQRDIRTFRKRPS